MGAIFAGLAGGFAEGMHERNLINLHRNIEHKKLAVEQLGKLASAPDADPDFAQSADQLRLEILMGKPHDKMKKYWERYGTLMNEAYSRQQKRAQDAADKEYETNAIQGMMAMGPPPPPEMGGTSVNLRFPQAQQGGIPRFRIPQEELLKREIGAKTQLAEAQAEAHARGQMTVQEEKERRDLDAVRSSPWYDKLSPIQQAEVERRISIGGGGPIGVPQAMKGSDLLTFLEADSSGTPIDPERQYRIARDRQTNEVVFAVPIAEEQQKTLTDYIPDAESKITGVAKITRTVSGKPVSVQRDVLPPVGYAPKTTTAQRVTHDPITGEIQIVGVTSTTKTQLPGQPSIPPAPTSTGARGGGGAAAATEQKRDKIIADWANKVEKGEAQITNIPSLALRNRVTQELENRGSVILQPKEREVLQGIEDAKGILGQIDGLVDKIGKNPTDLESMGLLKNYVESIRSILSKRIFLETGVLTDKDVARAGANLPGGFMGPIMAATLTNYTKKNIAQIRGILSLGEKNFWETRKGTFKRGGQSGATAPNARPNSTSDPLGIR